ncbi:hypothetical protein GQ457_06G014180 [Hibiscus cannabinus]
MVQLINLHVGVLAFPFSTYAAPLLTIINHLASSSPNTMFSFFSTAQSNNCILFTSQSTPPNIKAYNEDIELFMTVAPQNFRKGMEWQWKRFAKEMALENGVLWLPFYTAETCSLSSHVFIDLLRETYGVEGCFPFLFSKI